MGITGTRRVTTRVARLALAALYLCLIAGGVLATAATAHADDSTATLNIAIPVPSNGQTEGPVGTNVTLQAQGLTPSDQYQLGYASQGSGCTSGFSPFPSVTAQAAADGTLGTTFAWPGYVYFVGNVYYICLTDATTPNNVYVQSVQTFKVDADSKPAIQLQPVVSSSTPTAATATPATPGVTTFSPGGQVALTGQNFFPSSVTLVAYLLNNQAASPADLTVSAAVLLEKTDHTNKFNADGSGKVSVTLVLPDTLKPGSYYIYVVSNDGSTSLLPSLEASQQLTVVNQPTPTPTIAPTATPAHNGTSGGGSAGGGVGKVLAVISLGGLSLVLFVLGVAFIASAATLPKEQA